MVDTISLDRFDDLATSQEEGKEFDLRDEMGKPIGLKLTLVGPDSTRTRKAMKDTAKEFSKLAEERALSGKETPEEEERERTAAFLARITTGWAPNPSIAGKAVPFNEENARNFYRRYPIFAEQAEAIAVRRGPFVKSSSVGSAS